MLRALNQKKLIKHLSRFLHDRKLPDIKPNTSLKQKTIGTKSPMKESRIKLDYSSKSSKKQCKDEDGDLLHLIFKNKKN